MRIAIPQWQERVSPVFDVAQSLLLIDMEDGIERRREERRLPEADAFSRLAEFFACRASVLICGAISAPVEARLTASGVQVIGFRCGFVEEVLAAYGKGELSSQAYAMPGCRSERLKCGEGDP
jgi:predicted Fe-Mo cluster-binding NifX family protein